MRRWVVEYFILFINFARINIDERDGCFVKSLFRRGEIFT